jgi:ABC-type Fe3+-siderophore transport system permease subunit
MTNKSLQLTRIALAALIMLFIAFFYNNETPDSFLLNGIAVGLVCSVLVDKTIESIDELLKVLNLFKQWLKKNNDNNDKPFAL